MMNEAELFRTDKYMLAKSIFEKGLSLSIDELIKSIYIYDLNNGTNGVLYCMYHHTFDQYGSDVYKLGRTISIASRRSTYQTSFIGDCKYLAVSREYPNYVMVEAILFHLLASKRYQHNREFFQCSVSLVSNTFDIITDMYNDNSKMVYLDRYMNIIKREVSKFLREINKSLSPSKKILVSPNHKLQSGTNTELNSIIQVPIEETNTVNLDQDTYSDESIQSMFQFIPSKANSRVFLMFKSFIDRCYTQERINDFDYLVRFGIIIRDLYAQDGFMLFDYFCSRTQNYQGTEKALESYSTWQNTDIGWQGITLLYHWALTDNYQEYRTIMDLQKNDIIKDILTQPNNLLTLCSELFYCLYVDDFIYDLLQKKWYYVNSYGICVEDIEMIVLKSKINTIYSNISMSKDEMNISSHDSVSNFNNCQKYLHKSSSKSGIIQHLVQMYGRKNITNQLDCPHDNIFAFDNGVFDLSTYKFRSGASHEFITHTTGYDYRRADRQYVDEVRNILANIFPDKEELDYVMMTIAISLSVHTLGKSYMWIGNAGNGKGVLRDFIMHTFGSYFATIDMDHLYKSQTKKSIAQVRSIIGKSRIVIANDTREKQIFSANKLNYYAPQCFDLIVQSNFEPVICKSNIQDANKWVFIKFPTIFVNNPKGPNERPIDLMLKTRINSFEYKCAFFEIIVGYYRQALSIGLSNIKLPKRIDTDTNPSLHKNDYIHKFVAEQVILTSNGKDRVKAADLYNAFCSYNYPSNGCISQNVFSDVMQKMGITKKRFSSGSVYCGVQLKEYS